MKTILSSTVNPTFTPGSANAGTLNFSTAVTAYGFTAQRLFAVIDLTTNTIIYAASQSGTGGAWNSGTSVLTLQASTISCSSGDLLEVIWDDPRASVILDAPNPSVPTGWPSKFHLVTAATTNATSVKASTGTLGGIFFNCLTSEYGCLKIYDKASAPTVGTDSPVLSIVSGTNTASWNAVASTFVPAAGIKFINGIAIAVTLNAADSDTTAVSAGLTVNLLYA